MTETEIGTVKIDASKLVRYRNCVEELRTLANDHHTVENRRALIRIAAAYDQMADSIEEMLKQGDLTSRV